jgi:nucleoside-diphosphate-sugar epimerase
MPERSKRRVLVTGGAGYVGSALVPKLLDEGHEVVVLDLFLYGDDVLPTHPGLRSVRGDLRDAGVLAESLRGCDTVIHLACISNDPSFELDPALGRSINLDSFRPLVRAAKDAGVDRFVYASSSSVYGVKEGDVTEDVPLEPLTDYSRFKADCEQILAEEREAGFTTLTIRPATVCGYAPRLRLDVVVNILTAFAYHRRRITVHGGSQLRPNIHVEDMADLYVLALELAADRIDGRTYNAGSTNYDVMTLAEMARGIVGDDVDIEVVPSGGDPRSYHVSSQRVFDELGWRTKRTIEDAIRDLVDAFGAGLVPNAMDDPKYYNIRTMQDARLA